MLVDDLLHIYQGDYYDARRFIRTAYDRWRSWTHLQTRGTLQWTLRAKLILVGVFLLAGLIVSILMSALGIVGLVIGLALSYISLPLLIVGSDGALRPLILLQKRSILARAEAVRTKYNHLVVVGITGSYGKTTTKHILAGVLSSKKVLMVPGNINTDIGVAQWITGHANELADAEVLIVEMGAHHPGDIEALCAVAQPTHGILTAIQPVHLERFGSVDAVAQTKLELAYASSRAVVLNMHDENIARYTTPLTLAKDVDIVRVADDIRVTYKDNFSGMTFTYKDVTFETTLLGTHIPHLLALCVPVAERLGVSLADMQWGFSAVSTPDHRLSVTHNPYTRITIIDDSYNGSLNGFKAALEVLSHARGRKVVLTPGIVELGDMQQEVHEALAQEYMAHVDHVLLIENSATRHIVRVFKDRGFEHYNVYPDATQAHRALKDVLQSEDTILFQNDWSDIYH